MRSWPTERNAPIGSASAWTDGLITAATAAERIDGDALVNRRSRRDSSLAVVARSARVAPRRRVHDLSLASGLFWDSRQRGRRSSGIADSVRVR
jgi:hypothetical protein